MFACSKNFMARLVTITAIVSAAFAASTMTTAQEVTQNQVDEQIRTCGAIADTADRMDCFNAVVENLDEDSAGAAGASIDAGATASPSGTEPALAAGAAVVTESAVDDFGLEEQKAADAREKEEELEAQNQVESIHANIVTSNKSGLNHFVVVLDNDQVWEETDGSRRIGLPKVGRPVEIYRGKLGGYRMKVGNDNRIAWVRRLR
jgi:hypothetical protein